MLVYDLLNLHFLVDVPVAQWSRVFDIHCWWLVPNHRSQVRYCAGESFQLNLALYYTKQDRADMLCNLTLLQNDVRYSSQKMRDSALLHFWGAWHFYLAHFGACYI